MHCFGCCPFSPCDVSDIAHEETPIVSSYILGDFDSSHSLHDPNTCVHNMLPNATDVPYTCMLNLHPHRVIHNNYSFMMDDMFLYHASNFYERFLSCVNSHVHIHIMMDDVYIYHAHNFFGLCLFCVGYLDYVSTSTSRELTIRALESEPHTFDHDSFLRHLSYHFGIVKNAQGHAMKVISFLSMDIADHTTCAACTMRLIVHLGPLDCTHVRDLASTCHFHRSMHHDIYALCVASNSWIIFSYHMLGCNNTISSHMPCLIDCYMIYLIASHMMNNCSFYCVECHTNSLHPMHVMLGLSCT